VFSGRCNIFPIGCKNFVEQEGKNPVNRMDITKNGNKDGITVVRHSVIPSEAPEKAVLESKINTSMAMDAMITHRRDFLFIIRVRHLTRLYVRGK
jgi:hypothetical protein